MRTCPKCKKEYDDSWKVCIKCNVALIEDNMAPEVKNEILSIKTSITKLNERINLLEYSLKAKKAEAAPVAKVEIEPEIEIARRELRITEKPIFKEEIVEKVEEVEEVQREPIIPRKRWSESFEQMLGGKLFNKLGILAVVIGVALLIGYSFKYLGPIGKIAIGYAFGLGILIFGNHIEKRENFSIYGKTLIGGGWAITYFTTYAMHHIPVVRLIQSPILGILLLMGVSIATVLHIYKYKSELATAFSYLLIFITLMISPVTLYTMATAALVAVSLIFFMYKERWARFGFYGMAMTYITYTGWLFSVQNAGTGLREFLVASGFLGLYWAIFIIATFLIRDEDNGDEFFGIREKTHLLNTLAASFLMFLVLQNGFMRYMRPSLLILAGLYLGLTAISYLIKKRPLYIISSSFSILFTLIFLSIKYTGYPLTASYIILAQIILLAGIMFKESYWRMFSFGFLLVIIGKILLIDLYITNNAVLLNNISERTLLLTFAFAVYLVDHIVYTVLQKRNLLTKTEKDHPAILSYAYVLIYMVGTWLDLPKVLTAPAWIGLGVILLQMGISTNNNHQRLQGYILGIGSFVRLLMSNMTIEGGMGSISYRLLSTIPVLLLFYYCLIILNDEKTKAILKDAERKMGILYPYMVFVALMFLTRYEAPESMVAPTWGIIALIYSFVGVKSKQMHYLSISSLAAISAAVRAIFINLFEGRYLVGVSTANIIYPIFTIGALYIGNIIYLTGKEKLIGIETVGEGPKKHLRSPRLIFGLAATILLTTLLAVKLKDVSLTIGLGLEGLLLFLAGFGLKDKNWRIYGLIVLLLTLLKAFLIDLRQLSTLYYILSLIALGLALLFVSFIYTKYKDKLKKLI